MNVDYTNRLDLLDFISWNFDNPDYSLKSFYRPMSSLHVFSYRKNKWSLFVDLFFTSLFTGISDIVIFDIFLDPFFGLFFKWSEYTTFDILK